MDGRAIGVFDSGVGGVSVLRDLCRLLPEEKFLYLGDNKNAPYGTRQEQEILSLTQNAVDWLVKRNIKALVVACNTATSAAAQTLRDTLSMPVVGMEPALKPAALAHEDGLIAVLATPATLRQQKFQHLLRLYGQDAVLLPCAGLMEFAERGELDGDALGDYLTDMFSRAPGRIGAAVLGCTHYVFLKRAIADALPGVPLYDGNDGTARRLRALLDEGGLRAAQGSAGGVEFHTTGDESVYLPMMRRLFATPI